MVRKNGLDNMLCGQNGIGQNGSGQTGTDNMVWTKINVTCTDKMLIDKMVRTNWYGQEGTGNKIRTKCYMLTKCYKYAQKILDRLKRL